MNVAFGNCRGADAILSGFTICGIMKLKFRSICAAAASEPRYKMPLWAALLLGATACTATSSQDDTAAIRAALIAWRDDFNARHTDRVCDIFAPELRFDFRGQPERGYSEMCAQLQRATSDQTRRFTYALQIKEVLVSGDLAIVRLVWRLTTDTASDEPGLDVFRRQADGSWKIIRYMAYEEPHPS